MHEIVRGWIVDVLRGNEQVVAIALRQRAKFEGWLKFELAAHAEWHGATAVHVESAGSEEASPAQGRCDLSFCFDQGHYDIELKTPNSNWRVPGVLDCTRPITKNIEAISADARKLSAYAERGLVAFVLFPIPTGDRRWCEYLKRIARDLGMDLPPAAYTTQLTFALSTSHSADLAVGCFPVRRLPPAS